MARPITDGEILKQLKQEREYAHQQIKRYSLFQSMYPNCQFYVSKEAYWNGVLHVLKWVEYVLARRYTQGGDEHDSDR